MTAENPSGRWLLGVITGGVGVVACLPYTDLARSLGAAIWLVEVFIVAPIVVLLWLGFILGKKMRHWRIVSYTFGPLFRSVPATIMIFCAISVRSLGETSVASVGFFYCAAFATVSWLGFLRPQLDLGFFTFLCTTGGLQAYMHFHFTSPWTWCCVIFTGGGLQLLRGWVMMRAPPAADSHRDVDAGTEAADSHRDVDAGLEAADTHSDIGTEAEEPLLS